MNGGLGGLSGGATRDEVVSFLLEVKYLVASGKWEVVDRVKNLQGIMACGMLPSDIPAVIQSLTPAQYVEGPLPDHQGRRVNWWVFGAADRETEIYVKLGVMGRRALVLSFHPAERPLVYPFGRK